jgi:hypothetical protein
MENYPPALQELEQRFSASDGFTDILKTADIRISMDGKGRVFDNIFICLKELKKGSQIGKHLCTSLC